MKTLFRNPVVTAILGLAAGLIISGFQGPRHLTAGTASGNDKFSMVTVPVTGVGGIGDTEAVFVLDHLTGILTGGWLNTNTGTFSHQFVRNVGADFQIPAGDRNPAWALVSGAAQLRGSGNQPALGAIYIAEKNSGAVLAYGFQQPRGRGAAVPLNIVRIAGFNFREPAN